MPDARLDVAALYSSLDTERQARKISWRQLAKEADVSPSTLTRMAQGKRPDVDSFAALTKWLNIPADQFLTGRKGEDQEPDPVTQVAAFLRARKDLSPQSAEAIADIVKAAYKAVKGGG